MYSTQNDDRMRAAPDAEMGEFDIDEFACFGLCDDEDECGATGFDFAEASEPTQPRMNITDEQEEQAAENVVLYDSSTDIQAPAARDETSFPINVISNAREAGMPEGTRALRIGREGGQFFLEVLAIAQRPFADTLRIEFLLPVQFSMQRADSASPTMYVLVNGVDKTAEMPRAYMEDGSRVLTWTWTPAAKSNISMVMLRLPVEVEGTLPSAGVRSTVRVTYDGDRPIIASALALPLPRADASRPIQIIGMDAQHDSGLSVAARARALRRAANADSALQAQAIPAAFSLQPAAAASFGAAPAANASGTVFAAAPALPAVSEAAAYATPRRVVTASVTAPAFVPAMAPVRYPVVQFPQMEVNIMSELPPIMTNPDAFNYDGSSVYAERIRFIRSEETVQRDTMLTPGQVPMAAAAPALPQGPSEFQSRIVFRRAFPG